MLIKLCSSIHALQDMLLKLCSSAYAFQSIALLPEHPWLPCTFLCLPWEMVTMPLSWFQKMVANKRTNERTNELTRSFLELHVAAKNLILAGKGPKWAVSPRRVYATALKFWNGLLSYWKNNIPIRKQIETPLTPPHYEISGGEKIENWS